MFKKSNTDRYMERPSATFCNGKYNVLDDFFTQHFQHVTQLKINHVRPANIKQMN